MQIVVNKLTDDSAEVPTRIVRDLNQTCIFFEHANESRIYCHTGDHLCYTEPQSKTILALDITSAEPPFVVKRINMSEYVKDEVGFVNLTSVDPHAYARMKQVKEIDQAGVARIENYLQVTVDDTLLVFDLNLATPHLIDEESSLNELSDP